MRYAVVLSLAATLFAQSPNQMLSRAEFQKVARQAVQLMEASSVAVPALARAGAPMVEDARQDAKLLEAGATWNHSAILHRFLGSLRAYLELSAAVPKPFPFAEEARRQLTLLRETQERLEAHFSALLDAKERQLRNPDRDNLRRYAEANASLGRLKPGETRVVFLGDSITDGWRLNEYFPGKPYVNRGIGGQITGEMLGRMKADVLDLKPAAVLILAATNDIARGVPVTTIQNNLAMLADLAAANGAKPIFASVLPVSDYHKDRNPAFEMTRTRPPATILELNKWIQDLCKQRGFLYVDYFSAAVDAQGYLKAELADDGLHPNAAGYRVMGPLAQEAIGRALAPPPKKGKRLGIF